MSERGFSARIGSATLLSVLLHAGVLVALSTGLIAPGGGTLPEPRERQELGIRNSAASTITWIGFEEEIEQQAPQATLEQAAQARGGAAQGVPDALREMMARRAQQTSRAAAAALDAAVRALREIDFSTSEQPAERVEQEQSEASRGAPEPSTRTPTPGDAERESDAVSIEEPIRIQWGRPIAAQGLEILTRTKGPDFSAYTSVTARPKPLFVEISFGPEGGQQVKRVDILGSSGNIDIDRPYVNVIYTWRARGEKIDALAEDEVVKVRLRIIVNLR